MSYFDMDHAKWAANDIAASKRRELGARRRKPLPKTDKGYIAAPDELTEFQQKVFDIVGIAGGGIYNAPIGWSGIVWDYGQGMAIPWRGDLSTFDGADLSLLVMACHEARIRLEIRPHAYRYLLLCFWPRGHEGGIGRRHPSMQEHNDQFQALLPADHRIRYKP